MRSLAAIVAVASCAACSGGAAGSREPHVVEGARVAMGTELRLTAWTADQSGAAAAFADVYAEFDRLDAILSIWQPGSEVTQLNAAAGLHPVAAGPEMRAVLTAARTVSEWTDGRFDVTFGVLSGLWKFDHDQDNRLPDMDQVRRLLPLIDYRSLIIDEGAGTAFLTRRGMRAHLGGIGKGYAIDRAAALMRARGFADFMIQAGGDIYVAGRRQGQPWRVGVQDPRGSADRVIAALDLSDAAISTSGDYERFFMKDGRRYHHIIDPRTGEPSQAGCRSVTIVAGSATVADGLSTGVFLLGPERGLALAERLPGVEAIIVTAANRVLVTPALKERVSLRAPPTDSP